MADERRIPDDPVLFIQDRVRRALILWTYHVNMRLAGRFIPREAILAGVDPYELVASYPDDKYLPSYLLLAQQGPNAFHVLLPWTLKAIMRDGYVYRPDDRDWEPDLKTRSPKQ